MQTDEEKLQHSKDQRYATLYGTTGPAENPPARQWRKELEKNIVCLKVTFAVVFMCVVIVLLIIPLLS